MLVTVREHHDEVGLAATALLIVGPCHRRVRAVMTGYLDRRAKSDDLPVVRQFVREGRLGAAVLSLAEGDQDGASMRRPLARLAGKPHTGAFSNQWCGFGE